MTITQPAYFTGTKRRVKCPVHHGNNLSVAVGYIDGRAWAKCWSQGCASKDILAALGITNDSSIPWTPPPAPRPRPAVSIAPLPPVSPFAASKYLEGILRPYPGSAIAVPAERRPAWDAQTLADNDRTRAASTRHHRRWLAT